VNQEGLETTKAIGHLLEENRIGYCLTSLDLVAVKTADSRDDSIDASF